MGFGIGGLGHCCCGDSTGSCPSPIEYVAAHALLGQSAVPCFGIGYPGSAYVRDRDYSFSTDFTDGDVSYQDLTLWPNTYGTLGVSSCELPLQSGGHLFLNGQTQSALTPYNRYPFLLNDYIKTQNGFSYRVQASIHVCSLFVSAFAGNVYPSSVPPNSVSGYRPFPQSANFEQVRQGQIGVNAGPFLIRFRAQGGLFQFAPFYWDYWNGDQMYDLLPANVGRWIVTSTPSDFVFWGELDVSIDAIMTRAGDAVTVAYSYSILGTRGVAPNATMPMTIIDVNESGSNSYTSSLAINDVFPYENGISSCMRFGVQMHEELPISHSDGTFTMPAGLKFAGERFDTTQTRLNSLTISVN